MNASVGAVIRGKAALDEVRVLLDQLALADRDYELCEGAATPTGTLSLTTEEVQGVITRRREAILNKLENKGIRVAPEPASITSHSETTKDNTP